jgi:excisionase family DNA binding protein
MMTSESSEMFESGLRTVEEARQYTRLSRSSLYALMEKGDLIYTKIGRRRLIPHRALVELAHRGLVVR